MKNGIIERMQAEIGALKSQVAELNAIHGKRTEGKDVVSFAEAYNGIQLCDYQREAAIKLTPLTAQDIRDSIVEQAKRDVAQIEYDQSENLLRMQYVVNAEKRTVVCLAWRVDHGYIDSRGIAKCAPSDCFNANIGKAIALRRALGLDVPSEYLTAPQPTKVRVGDVVEYSPTDTNVRVVGNNGDFEYLNTTHLEAAEWSMENDALIILDDSREGDAE